MFFILLCQPVFAHEPFTTDGGIIGGAIYIIVLILFILIHIPFVLFSFFFAVNSHSYSIKKIKVYNIALPGFLLANVLLFVFLYKQNIYFYPAIIFLVVPLLYYIIANLKKRKPFLNWLLSIFYLINFTLFLLGGNENHTGFGPQNGQYKRFYDVEETKIRIIEYYRFGYKTGAYKSFFENGQLMTLLHYNNDIKDGQAKEYYDNGHLKSSYNYINNQIEGEYLSFYRNKKQESNRRFKNGLLEGLEKIYYENGELSSLFHYKNGQKSGLCKEFYQNGTLKSFFIYGISSNECSIYHPNGQIKVKGKCIGQKRVGLWECYHDNGILSETGYYIFSEYTNSMKHGLWKTYHSNGKLETIGEFVKGIRSGKWVKYFEDGEESDSRYY